MNWLANFCVVITCPVMFTNIKYQTYATYAVINFAIIPTIYFFYPETGSRSLEEIDLLGPTKVKMVEEAQAKIVSVIRSLEDSGQIEVQRGGETDELIA